ncbi:hypothetical protein L873DRAFT_1826258 [Choiromyces venosus 120613-1]|uniref:alpha-D-xyloside xylohydrolase n=1 Tax=Choiromyces venosus 120613-1 TaxID=1336337 RepID=A0A3N4JZ09_9PEZI|nr:hypothetical protein L873DRAFT_1826258 [Choiromyces venosus 120613-1]
MKFRDGMWLVREGRMFIKLSNIHRVLVWACFAPHIHSRGGTLNLSTLTLDIEATFDDVISITTRHWKGARNRGPHYELFPDGKQPVNGKITISEVGTTLTSGNLACIVSSNTLSTLMKMSDMSDISHYIFTMHNLAVGESIYGLGERFTAFNKVRQALTLYNADGGTSSEEAYKNVPFYLSSNGYGVFIDHPEPVDLEIGSERLKWYIIYGPDPKEILRKYTALTGKPGKVPLWSFGLWLSTSFTTSYDEATVSSFLDGMKEREIPVHVFHYDCFWLREFHWCDFEFSKEHFLDPKSMMTRLRAERPGLKFCVWRNPYLGDASPIFAEAAEGGYLVKRPNGDVWQWDLWQAGMGLVDFTNPTACEWYVKKLESLFDVGIDCLKTDFGERIPDRDVAWHDKSLDPVKMHNYYAFLYNKVVCEALQKRYGRDQAVLFARTATAGTQRFPLQLGGDCESTFEAMAESLRGGPSLGISGFAYWSVDIGGFKGKPDPDVYKRWVAFGLLCSHSRLHGSNSYRVPWAIDDESTSVLCTITDLKCRLIPYLYAQATQSIISGLPVSLRTMFFEFPEDPTSWYLDRQYMLGDPLLIASVFGVEGEWTSFLTGEVKEGPKWVTEIHHVYSLPIYIREGSVLVLGKEGEKRVVYDYFDGAEVRVCQPVGGSDGRSATVVDEKGGAKGEITLKGSKLTLPEVFKGFKVLVDGKARKDYQTAPQNKNTASYNHPAPTLPATTLPAPPLARGGTVLVGVTSELTPPLVAVSVTIVPIPVVLSLPPPLPIPVLVVPVPVGSANVDLFTLVKPPDPVALGVPRETVLQVPKLNPTLALPPGSGSGVLVQDDSGGAFDR